MDVLSSAAQDKLSRKIWTTKDNEEIPVEELKQQHLENILPWIERVQRKLEDQGVRLRQKMLACHLVPNTDADSSFDDDYLDAVSDFVDDEFDRRMEFWDRWIVIIKRELAKRAGTVCNSRSA